MERQAASSAEFGDPTRRTHLAQERTLLAWWRTGLACLAVGLAVGRILPEVAHVARAPFLVLGVGYGGLGIIFVVIGSWRQHVSRRIFAEGRFHHLSDLLLAALTIYMVVLAIASVVVLFYKI